MPLGITPLVRCCCKSNSHTSDCSTLGDGTVLFRFLHTLSQFYQGLSPEFATPSFKKYHFPTPSYSVVAEFWPRIPHLHKPYDFGAPAKPSKSCEHMRWRINSCDIEDLYSAISSKKQSGPSLSKQDCITAYLVAVLNHNRSNPVQKVINITSVSYFLRLTLRVHPHLFSVSSYKGSLHHRECGK